MNKRKKVIKVAPRPEVIRKRYADFLTGLENYLAEAKEKLEAELRKNREEEEYSLAE
ncbi:MAG: hypothetical protein IKA79_04105 [Lentisphaeria bacterium]|nr:hypothetical protein [Lentisphaeria bacterium]